MLPLLFKATSRTRFQNDDGSKEVNLRNSSRADNSTLSSPRTRLTTSGQHLLMKNYLDAGSASSHFWLTVTLAAPIVTVPSHESARYLCTHYRSSHDNSHEALKPKPSCSIGLYWLNEPLLVCPAKPPAQWRSKGLARDDGGCRRSSAASA